jgi:uncharacterized protein (DUF983 family)
MTTTGPPQATLGELLFRALCLRCPRCGRGKLFRGLFSMFPECEHCKLRYERAPGYFLGSTYINYGVTAVVVTIVYLVLHVGIGFSNRALAGPLAGFCVLFPLYFFRYARALWLALDSFLDPATFDSTDRAEGEDLT